MSNTHISEDIFKKEKRTQMCDQIFDIFNENELSLYEARETLATALGLIKGLIGEGE